MFAKKIVLAAAALAALTAAGLGAADAQTRNMARNAASDHRGPVAMRHEVHRPYVNHARIHQTLRMHRYVGLGNPYFLHGRYVVRSHDRFGRTVLVQLDPWTGRFIGVVRI